MTKTHNERGAAMLLFMVFFVVAISTLTWALAQGLYADTATMRSLATSKQSYATGEASLEEVVYRIMGGTEGITEAYLEVLLGAASTTVVHDDTEDTYTVKTAATTGRAERIIVIELEPGTGTAFNYGLQTGNGGFRIENNSSVIGNAFSNGTIEGQGSARVTGDAISAGPSGHINSMNIEGSVWTNTLESATVDGDAHYNVEVGSNSVGGDRFSPFEVVDEEDMPISEEEIDEWQDAIIDTGTIIPASACSGGTYTISDDTVMGNVKIECDLLVTGSGGGTELTLNGPLWVAGDVEFTQGPTIRVSSFVSPPSIPIIVDDPADRENRGQAIIRNSTEFVGTGASNSYIMVLSRNTSASQGGDTTAISIGQSSAGDLILYSNYGNIAIGNNIDANSATAYRIDVSNGANVTYEEGLANVLFSGGPGAAYTIKRWYQE